MKRKSGAVSGNRKRIFNPLCSYENKESHSPLKDQHEADLDLCLHGAQRKIEPAHQIIHKYTSNPFFQNLTIMKLKNKRKNIINYKH